MTQTIAIFSTYSPSEGFGGPARIFHERTVLESAGHQVIHVVLQPNHANTDGRRHDFVRTVERPYRAPIDHIYHDVDLGRRAAADESLISSIISHLRRHATTAIMLEQPFLVDVVEQASRALDLPVIYSSQNVEYRLRQDLERFQFDWKRPTDRSDEVRQIERRAVELASVVTTICENDRHVMADEFGCDSTIVPNGTSVASIELRPTAGPTDPIDFAFAGSSYWPNVEGFGQIATPSLAFLPPGTKIHVAGSVGAELLTYPGIAKHQSVNASRIDIRGFLPMNELVDMMSRSRAVLVPVFIGEGSNLKSADALASGSPVIMTERATHGYEDVLSQDAEGVTVVGTPGEFRAAMTAALRTPWSNTPIGRTRHCLLEWSTRLAVLLEAVDEAVRCSSTG